MIKKLIVFFPFAVLKCCYDKRYSNCSGLKPNVNLSGAPGQYAILFSCKSLEKSQMCDQSQINVV